MIRTATTAPSWPIRLTVETIITSHTNIAYRVEHKAQGKPPHHGFSLLISVEPACAEHYPWVYCTW